MRSRNISIYNIIDISVLKGVTIFMAFLKDFFSNKWTKRCVSVVSLTLGVLVVFLSYMSLFYDVQITNPQTFGVTIGGIVLVLGIVMVYTRKNLITSIVSMITLLLLLPMIIFCWGNWLLLIPLLALSILMFFLCGASENTKTVLGTIYVFIYIMAVIAYFLYSNLIIGQTLDTKSENYVSESGTYRCYLVDTKDSSTGSTKIYVEPNKFDTYYNGIAFIAKDYERIVYNIRERKEVSIEWREDDLYIDNELRFRSSDAEENQWFVFLDYKTRIANAKDTVSSLYKKISKKLSKSNDDSNIEDSSSTEPETTSEETQVETEPSSNNEDDSNNEDSTIEE